MSCCCCALLLVFVFTACTCSAANFEEAMRMGTETYHTLRSIIQNKYGEWTPLLHGVGVVLDQPEFCTAADPYSNLFTTACTCSRQPLQTACYLYADNNIAISWCMDVPYKKQTAQVLYPIICCMRCTCAPSLRLLQAEWTAVLCA